MSSRDTDAPQDIPLRPRPQDIRPRPSRQPRVDPAGRPLEGRVRQGFQAVGIVLLWIFVCGFVFWVTGGGPTGRGSATGPAMIALGVLCWAGAEVVAGRRGLVWPGSALGIVGALSVGLGVSALTPELRASPVTVQLTVISGVAAVLMGIFLFRYRLPGLVSPTVTFTIVALFLGLYGTDPAKIAEVEGFSPRGVLAAMLDIPLVVLGVAALGLAAVAAGRRLDLHGDDFGLAAARPLHLIGAGVFCLIAGRWIAALPQPLDWLAFAALWVAAGLWALRINRVAVMVTAHLAMTKPTFTAFGEPWGFVFQPVDWQWALPVVLTAGFAIWPFMHEAGLRRGFILGPGGKIPTRGKGFWWRYWPYS